MTPARSISAPPVREPAAKAREATGDVTSAWVRGLPDDRQGLLKLVSGIEPVDEQEVADRADMLAWIAGDAELYRQVPPAIPPKHLVT